MAVKGVIINPVLGAVVLSKGIVGFAGVNLLGMFCVCVGKPEVTRQLCGGFLFPQPVQGSYKINQDVYKRQRCGSESS